MKVASCGKALCSVRTATLKSALRIVKSASLAEAYHRWVGQATASVPHRPRPPTYLRHTPKFPQNVRPPVYNSLMNELETELLSLKAELEAENFAGSTDDENPDPRMTRVSEILTLLEVFYWADYKRILIANFDFPADYWK